MMMDGVEYTSAPAIEVSNSRVPNVPALVSGMNDVAIEHLKANRSDDACRLLIDAHQVLETYQHFYCENPSMLLPHHCSSTSLPVRRPFAETCCSTDYHRRHHRRPLNTRLPERDGQANLPTGIYNRAFFIYSTGCRNARIDMAVLAFNIALSYHLKGVGQGESISLHRALVWYNYSHRIVLEESRVWENRNQARLIVLLCAALCHNMAAIHGDQFWEFGRARLLRCQLAQVIHWEGSRFSQMATDDFVFFHLGIFFAIIDDFRVAPAA